MTNLNNPPIPRNALLRSIRHPISKEVLDRGLILWFPGPNSFTGEDSCEFHVHGGIAVVTGVLDALGSLANFKLAQPGEFTKRAFMNGKLDLTEVEGLADLLQAETEQQRKQAFLQSNGSLSKLYLKWKKVLLHSVAHVEAYIDFDETETLDHGLIESVVEDVKHITKELKSHLENGCKGELLRRGVKTVILGQPNVGKSSLLNLLCQRPVSIVTPVSGTTRDVIEVTLNINGYPLVLLDTAGLRNNSQDIIEIEGMARALEMYKNADLIILVTDLEKYLSYINKTRSSNFAEYISHYVNSLGITDLMQEKCNNQSVRSTFNKNCIVVLNKTDLDNENLCKSIQADIVKLSCKNENGISDLVDVLSKQMEILCGNPCEEHPSMNQMRHKEQLSSCQFHLDLFLKEALKGESSDLVILAEYLRRSLRHLGQLIGTVTSEDILNVIFRDFCIGK
ncbi:tRNA modification GTPase GTPBP3, mitochondrial isoform X2 [Sitophilus oryzae]|nr:tRNA modification GTPase GTPBP3, mitochondrial isoform X2 [Sitophilus oryzae]